MTMVGGEMLYEGGTFATMDAARAIERVERMQEKLRG